MPIIRNPSLARALRLIQQDGRDAFYRGDIAKAIVEKVQGNGGVMTPRDLAEFESEWVEPISTNYHGYDVFELPPPGQGFAALEMLNILEVCVPKLGFSLAALGPTNPMYWHFVIEAKKLAYADLLAHNADPKFSAVPVSRLISKQYAETLCSRINPDTASKTDVPASTDGGTIYLTTADRWGNMVSLIHSVYSEYGSGATVGPVRLRAPESRYGVLSRPSQPECRGAAQASLPYHHRRLCDEGWPAAHDVRQHGWDRAAGNPRSTHAEPHRPRHERADDDRCGAPHAQPERRTSCRSKSISSSWSAVPCAPKGMTCVAVTGAAVGGYQGILFTRDPALPEPVFDRRSVTDDRPVNGIYRAGSDHRKDGHAVGW